MRQHLAHAIDQFFQRESCGSRTGRKFRHHLAELTFTLGRFLLRLLVADEGPGALMGFEQAPQFQLAIRAHYRVGIDGQIDRELANRGKLIAGGERTGSESGPHLVDQLAVHGHTGVEVENEFEPPVLGNLPHKH